jgi:hypothetical protein
MILHPFRILTREQPGGRRAGQDSLPGFTHGFTMESHGTIVLEYIF